MTKCEHLTKDAPENGVCEDCYREKKRNKIPVRDLVEEIVSMIDDVHRAIESLGSRLDTIEQEVRNNGK